MTRWIGGVLLCGLLFAGPGGAHPEPEAPAEPEEKRPWEAKLAAGVSLREGDESKFSANGDVLFKYLWTSDSLTFRGIADYGESDGDRDTENYGANLNWRHDFTERFFWTSDVGGDSDQIQGRNLRIYANTGPGYRVWQGDENEFFDVSAGAGYRHERFRSSSGTPDNNLVDLVGSYDYQQTIGEVLEVIHGTDIFAPANDFDDFVVKSEVTLAVPLFDGLHFRNNARYEYVNAPAAGAKSSNFWLTLGLEYRL